MVLEDYKCCNEKCNHEFKGTKGPPTYCPKCGGKYCEWVSFKDWEYNPETERLERKKDEKENETIQCDSK
jgi:hypothetical protein